MSALFTRPSLVVPTVTGFDSLNSSLPIRPRPSQNLVVDFVIYVTKLIRNLVEQLSGIFLALSLP